MFAGAADWLKKKTSLAFRRLFFMVGKIGLTVLLSVVSGWGWVLFLTWSRVLNPLAIKLALVAALGITSGILARIILARNTLMLRWLSAFFSMGVSLLDLNRFTGGMAGFDMFKYMSLGIHWDALWQLTLGGAGAWAALSAWRSSVRLQPQTVTAIQGSPLPGPHMQNTPPIPDLRPYADPRSAADSRPAPVPAAPPAAAAGRHKSGRGRTAHVKKSVARRTAATNTARTAGHPASTRAAHPAHSAAGIQGIQSVTMRNGWAY